MRKSSSYYKECIISIKNNVFERVHGCSKRFYESITIVDDNTRFGEV
jgi:hypothetical protein